ncbi:centlein isoform X3 [Xenopus laevis]|uniref:Centlein isoform X3 n=1 Tax=Xenopus laevis TaxID=8355 RepID=A0A8J0V028_XENLA|nr:centlein isoform X3 [Xenopus laevis]
MTKRLHHPICYSINPMNKKDLLKRPFYSASMAAKQNNQEHVLKLEEEVEHLTEELSQCQADKEFVWSLWKRLQVANPDITQAIGLIVDREKSKAESKDRKVLEILQAKDSKIEELDQRTSGQQQEINNLVQRKIAVDEENILLKKELNDLQEKLKDKSQELKSNKENMQENGKQTAVILKNLELEKEGLRKRCADLLNDLEKAKKQEAQWKEDKSGIDGKIKDMEIDLNETRIQMEAMHSKINGLSSQVVVKQTELAQKETDLTRLRKELQELQNLYKQSNEHASQQAELIQQLQALNLDTQKVLRNQEDAHTTETISYQKLYNDLNVCYEMAKSSEAQLRQSNIALTEQLHQKEQQISQLQVKLQEALSVLPKSPQEPQDCEHPSLVELELIIASQKSEIKFLQDKLKTTDLQLTQVNNCGADALESSILRAGRKHEAQPAKRSRSLSPKGFSKESEELKKLKIAEKRIEHLEKALQIKVQENAEIRKAHERRRERLLTLQSTYRALKQQIEQCEEDYTSRKENKKRSQRADPWQLRHEDSDAVWNELAHFKRQHKKLLVEKMNLEEELDQIKVQASADKVTIQELNGCLQQEREELLYILAKEEDIISSTPKKNKDEVLYQALRKANRLETHLSGLEAEVRKLKGINEELIGEKHSLKLFIISLQKDAETRETKMQKLTTENMEAYQVRENLEVKNAELINEITALRMLLEDGNKLQNENRDLLRQIENLQRAQERVRTVPVLAVRELNSRQRTKKHIVNKVKQRAVKKISVRRHQAFLNQSIKVMSSVFENFSRDGWEDVSEDSDSEGQTLGSEEDAKTATSENVCMNYTNSAEENTCSEYTHSGCEDASDEFTSGKNNLHESVAKKRNIKKCCTRLHPTAVNSGHREKRNKILAYGHISSVSSLRQRVATLQHQVSVLQKGKQVARASADELKKEKIKLAAELHLAHQRLQISKQMAKKLSAELTEFHRGKEYLERSAEQMKEQLNLAKRSSETQSLLTSDQSPVAQLTQLKSSDHEMKQLQTKLKNMTVEITKQTTTIKYLKNEVQEKEDRIRELQERVARMERDVNMKRHLIEDQKTRLKTYQENERPSKDMLESLERKVKALTEECSHKKTSIDSLKQRLSVATKEKAQYEQMYHKVREDLEKKNVKVSNLETKVTESERAISKLENTATQQLHNLAAQSEQALEVVQNKLLLVNRRAEELATFVKSLAKELQLNTEEIRKEIRQANLLQEANNGPSKKSVHKAQSLAASILNISCTDLHEILDVQDEEKEANMKRLVEYDKEWMNHIMKLLEGQFPFASSLLKAVKEKLNEKTRLIEECTLLKRNTS